MAFFDWFQKKKKATEKTADNDLDLTYYEVLNNSIYAVEKNTEEMIALNVTFDECLAFCSVAVRLASGGDDKTDVFLLTTAAQRFMNISKLPGAGTRKDLCIRVNIPEIIFLDTCVGSIASDPHGFPEPLVSISKKISKLAADK